MTVLPKFYVESEIRKLLYVVKKSRYYKMQLDAPIPFFGGSQSEIFIS